jgi:hypothetical protein
VQQQAVQELHVRISQCLFILNAKTGRLVPPPWSPRSPTVALAAGVAVAPSGIDTSREVVNSSAVFPFDVIACIDRHQRW